MADPLPDLFPHQLDNAKRIAVGVPTYLGFDMGTGKTRTFIEAVKLRGAKVVLVICPASALLVWQREIQIWDRGASCTVVRHPDHFGRPSKYYLVSHGMLSQRQGAIAAALADDDIQFDMTAIDEAQAFNAPDSLRVRALRNAAKNLGDIIPLSGTPMKNHAGDLYTLLSICWPQGIRNMSRAQYEEKFCVVQHRDFQRNGRLIRVIEGSKNIPQLRKMIAPFMVRVRKGDVLKDLPAINWDQVPVPLDPAYMPEADLKAFEGYFSQSSVLGTPDDDMVDAMRVMGNSVPLMRLRRMLGLAKLRGATEYLVDMLDNLPEDRKILVFAHHADVIKALFNHLAEYSPAVLTGQSTPPERAIAVDKFLMDPKCRVFIGNIQAAGTALTLVGPKCKCSDVVFVESSWTPMDNAQAACRVHRIGQKDGVVARMLSAAGTVDDLISSLLARKARDFTDLFDTQPGGTQA